MRTTHRNTAIIYAILMTILLYFLASWHYQTNTALILTAIFFVLSFIEFFKMHKTNEVDPANIIVIILLVSLILKALN